MTVIIMNKDLFYLIYAVVEEIPKGKVATYGQIAKLIGKTKNSRLVGKALKMSAIYGDFPCHRVVNCAGKTAPNWIEQISLLKSEGVGFKCENQVDLKKYQWDCE